MKILIWGTGERATRIMKWLKRKDVIAFVDSDERKVGKEYLGIKIISPHEYVEKYREDIVLISHLKEKDTLLWLERHNIDKYFILSDCPGELQTHNFREDIVDYVSNYLDAKKDYILYGVTLYTLLVERWIYQKSGCHPIVVPSKADRIKDIDYLKKRYPLLNILEWNEVERVENKEVCAMSYQSYQEILNRKQLGNCITNLYDCSSKIPIYRNNLLKCFENKHKGEKCFIVATGPSLTVEDLEILKEKNVCCISMNYIYHAYEKTDWRPDYYVVEDWRAVKELSENKSKRCKQTAFVADTYDLFWEGKIPNDIYKFHLQFECCFDRLPRFSDNISVCCYNGCSVTYSCLQIAVYLGFTEIYLLGVDYSYSIETKKYGHFYKEKEIKSVGFGEQVFLAYNATKEYAQKNDIKIYNATRGGKLEVFERVDFDEIFV